MSHGSTKSDLCEIGGITAEDIGLFFHERHRNISLMTSVMSENKRREIVLYWQISYLNFPVRKTIMILAMSDEVRYALCFSYGMLPLNID